jgi:hypothetical protein
MDEGQWQECTDPGPMLAHLGGKASGRKLRLFACACCRCLWHLLTDDRSRTAVEVAERLADGAANAEELRSAKESAVAAHTLMGAAQAVGRGTAVLSEAEGSDYFGKWAAAHVARAAWGTIRVRVATVAGRMVAAAEAEAWRRYAEETVATEGDVLEAAARQAGREMQKAQAALARDIFGSPFRPVTVSPAQLAWRDGLVQQLAQAAYDNRRMLSGSLEPDRLAVLADALEESGCSDPAILGHLRSVGAHVRGCHVVDALLQKE